MTLALMAVAWLLTYLVHSTILLGGAWVLVATGVVKAPAVQDTLWKVCLVGGLLTATVQATREQPFSRHIWLPAAAAAAPAPASARPVVRAAEASGAQAAAASRTAVRRGVAGAGAAIPASADATPDTPHPTPGTSWVLILLGLWLTVAIALLARLLVRRHRFGRRLADRRVLTDGALVEALESLSRAAGLRRRVQLSVSPALSGPVAMGASEICLPERVLTALGPAEQRAVLAHELGHLVRRDPGWLAAAVAVESVWFVQPLNRLGRRRMQAAAEYLCDDWAVRQTGGGVSLARCLAEVASWMQARSPLPVSGMAENRSHLVARVQRLLDGAEPAARGVRLAVPVAALALATVAFAAPGVLPPCPAAAPAARAGAVVGTDPAPLAALVPVRGDTVTWATIRGGERLDFRAGYSARITGRGRLGIRRGGRTIELVDDQRLLVDGRPAGDGVVAVRGTDTVRIADASGRTIWTLTPVRVPAGSGDALGWSDREDLAGLDGLAPGLDSLDGRLDSLDRAMDVLDTIETAALAREVERVGRRLGRDISADVVPQLAELQHLGARISADVAPRVAAMGAEMGARIAARIGPIIAAAFGDSSTCDSGDAVPLRKRVPHKAAPRDR
jgi:beta-lactamase regulating signal transducer with metallopeptidase domain